MNDGGARHRLTRDEPHPQRLTLDLDQITMIQPDLGVIRPHVDRARWPGRISTPPLEADPQLRPIQGDWAEVIFITFQARDPQAVGS